MLMCYVCISSAQDAVSLAGLTAELNGGAAVVELHTTGPAEFQVDRFTMGDWVTVWSRSFQSSGVKEIPLEFDHPELADLVTGVSLVTENNRPGIRIYLGPEARRAGACTMRDGAVVQVHIPAVEGALLANAAAAKPEPAPAGGPGDSAQATLGNPVELAQPNSATLADAARTDQIAAQADTTQEDAAETTADDVSGKAQVEGSAAPDTTQGNAFFVPRQELPQVTGTPAADETTAATTEPASTPSGVKRGKHSTDNPVDFKPTPKKQKHPAAKPAAPAAPLLPQDPEMMLPARITENLPANAQIQFQYPADDSQSDKKDSGTKLDDISLKDLMDQATRSAAQMMGVPGAQPPSAQTALPGAIGTPSGPPAYTSFQAPAQVSAKLDGGPMLNSGKEALSGIMIDLFEILGTPLDQALTLLVAPTEYNIIVDSDVGKNLVSLSFKESRTDLKTALDLLTRTYGLEYVVDANTIVIAGKDKINGSLVDFASRVFVLSYADPKSVKDMLVKTGQLREDQIEVYQGEQAFAQVDDSTQLSEVSTGTAGAAAGSTIKAIETNLSSTPRNALLVKAVPSQMDMIAALITQLDRKPQLIDLEVRVCEAQEGALKNLGIAIQSNDTSTPTPIGSTWTEGASVDVDGNVSVGLGEAFSIGSFARNPLQFIAALNTQIQDKTVNVLAQPTLSTVEGKQAIYFAGETVPYISKVTQTATGSQVEVAFLKLGVTLNFKPRLDADGKLTIDVNPIVSSLLEFRKIGDLVEAPRTSERQLATTVRVSDCEPFVLAGLINTEERKTVTKVPFLADLPLVGKMFRNTNRTGQRTEIIVVVIPHIHQ